jgi:hypothetical protein
MVVFFMCTHIMIVMVFSFVRVLRRDLWFSVFSLQFNTVLYLIPLS